MDVCGCGGKDDGGICCLVERGVCTLTYIHVYDRRQDLDCTTYIHVYDRRKDLDSLMINLALVKLIEVLLAHL